MMVSTASSKGPDGPVGIDRQIHTAARLLATARQAAIAGLGCDAEALRRALALAARLGALVATGESPHPPADLRIAADRGLWTTTPGEVRNRADRLLVAGPGALAFLDHGRLCADAGSVYAFRQPRRMLLLATGETRPDHVAAAETEIFGERLALADAAALLAARADGRGVAQGPGLPAAAVADAALAHLAEGRFGVLVVDPDDTDHVTMDLLLTLVRRLDRGGRWTMLTVPRRHGERLARRITGWTTGDCLPLALGRGRPEPDAWRCDLGRAVRAGEVDALLWIGAIGPDLPAYAGDIPTIALLPHGRPVPAGILAIEVGVPGLTHPGVIHDARLDRLVDMPARAPDDRPAVASVLSGIDGLLAEFGR